MQLSDIIQSICPLPAPSLARFESCCRERRYPKGTWLYKQGVKASSIFFIKEGLVRALARRGRKEITFWFGMDGEVAFPIQSVFSGTTEYAGIEVLDDTVVYEVRLEHLQQLYTTDLHMANWGRKYAEYACIVAEKLFIANRFRTARERYEELITTQPEIIRRVPLGIVASYLGISQVSLSRIRALL